MTDRPTIVWLRRALRLADNPALAAALENHTGVVCVYVDDPDAAYTPGRCGRAWLARSLEALHASLQECGVRLLVLSGAAVTVLATLAETIGAPAVYADRSYVPETVAHDATVAAALSAAGVQLHLLDATHLLPPGRPLTAAGGPYRVFTPYHRAAARLVGPVPPSPAPERVALPAGLPEGLAPSALANAADAPPQMLERFTPGESGALTALHRFLAEAAAHYERGRDLPGIAGTSRLSPHLAFGEIAPWRVLDAAGSAAEADPPTREGIEAFVRQLYWRDFGSHLLFHFPHTAERPLRPAFEAMPWADDPEGLAAWRNARTGYPIVDAGMRELAATGWMHNRVRMIAASFLVKDLLIGWQEGERAFRELLVDADAGNNVLGWQWVAGSGADAAPYFRIFNPVAQGERHDPDGAYVRAWLPELAELPSRWIHRPHEAPADVLRSAGIVPGVTYPVPIVDHTEARVRALAAYEAVRAAGR